MTTDNQPAPLPLDPDSLRREVAETLAVCEKACLGNHDNTVSLKNATEYFKWIEHAETALPRFAAFITELLDRLAETAKTEKVLHGMLRDSRYGPADWYWTEETINATVAEEIQRDKELGK